MSKHTRKRRNILAKFEKAVLYLLPFVIAAAVIFLSVRAYGFTHGKFAPEALDAQGEGHTASITVTRGMVSEDAAQCFKDIGILLEAEGLIADSDDFAYLAQYADYANNVEVGTYTLSSEMTVMEMVEKMLEGPEKSEEETAQNGK